MRNRVFTIALAVGLLVGLMGIPAAADISDTGAILGEAQVGKTFWSGNDCDKTGDGTVVGEGLYVVGSTQDLARERQGAWHLDTVATSATLGEVVLEACGWLGPHDGTITDNEDRTSGLGPACGASKGHHGMGQVSTLGGEPLVKLMELGWKDAVGGVLPVTGKYQEYLPDDVDENDPVKRQKFGIVAAQVVALGGLGCIAEGGAQSFTVVGTYELVNTGATKPPKQPDKEMLPMTKKECKETDPDFDKEKDQDPGSDADFKRDECPTARKSP